MKKLNILFLLFACLFMTYSCEDDIEVMVPQDAVNPVLTSATNGGTFVLSKITENDPFATFEWTDADFKLDVSVQYVLEVDAKDGNFIGHIALASGIESGYSFTVGEFNKALLGAGFADGQTFEISVRIVAGNYLASEPVSMTVTTYFDAEPWSVIGSAVGGWNPENDQYMTYDKSTDTYSITLDLSPGAFKFRAPKSDASNIWAVNRGLTTGELSITEATGVALEQEGSNILTNGGNYTITLSVKNSSFSIVQNSASELSDWTGVELDAVGSGISIDNTNATVDGSGWAWGNVLLADNGAVPTANAGVYTWTWTGIILEADEGFKLRTKNGEAGINGLSFDVGFSAIDVDNSSTKIADKDGNISVTEKGPFDITLTVDAVNGDVKKVVISDPAPEYPAELYINGSFTGDPNWSWDAAAVIQMIPVHSNPHLFWKIAWFDADSELKFNSARAWNGSEFGKTGDAADGDGVWSKGGDNIPTGAEGYKMVVVNLITNTIQVTDPVIYAQGTAFGNWDGGQFLFTTDGTDAKILVSPAAVAADNARMYVTATTLTNADSNAIDWWQAEFSVLAGVIEYRGAGDDLAAAAITIGQKVKLNFSTETGLFE